MNFDFFIMAICIFAGIWMASKKSTETTEAPDIKKIIYTLLAVIVTLLAETLCTKCLAALYVVGLIITEILSMLFRYIGIALALFLLSSYKVSKKSHIALALCAPVLALVSQSYYNALYAEISAFSSGNLLETLSTTSSVSKIGLFMVILKAVPSVSLLLSYAIKMFIPESPVDTDKLGK